jgi:hypothetical protein
VVEFYKSFVGGVETGTMRMLLVAVQERTAETLMEEVKA